MDIRKELSELHNAEDLLNQRIGKIDKEIKKLTNEKTAIAKKVSKNYKQRNYLINRHLSKEIKAVEF
jgi:hypothetical protein